MIINRYLIQQISKPLATILGILAVLFGSFSAAGFLSDAVNGLLPTDTIAELIALQMIVYIDETGWKVGTKSCYTWVFSTALHGPIPK